MTPSPLRVLVAPTHPVQYQAPVWRALAAEPGLQVHAVFGSDMGARGYHDVEFGRAVAWDNPLLDGYSHEFLPAGAGLQRITVTRPRPQGLAAAVRRFQPAVVVLTAYLGLFHLGALAAAVQTGAAVVLRHEATDEAHARGGVKGLLRSALVRMWYRQVDAFAVIGTAARRHLLAHGVGAAQMVPSPYAVDTAFLEAEVARWQPRRAALREGLGLGPDDRLALFVGKLIPKKDPLLLVEARDRLPVAVRDRLHLGFVGTGALEPALEAALARAPGRVHRYGFLNQSEVGQAYAAADALVLPSRRGAGETWGLVVNEALQFGRPALVSDGVGCRHDLIRPGETGEVFAAGDAASLGQALAGLVAADEGCRAAWAVAARRHIAGFTTARAARGLAQACRLAAASRAGGPSSSA